MLVASRLHKTVDELLDNCSASQIADWIDFYTLQNSEPSTEDKEAQKRKEIAAKLKGNLEYFLKRQQNEKANRQPAD